MKHARLGLILALYLCAALAAPLPAQQTAPASQLSLERIFVSSDFTEERFGPAIWMKDGNAYTTVENSESVKGGSDIVRYQAATGKRDILVAAAKLIPAGRSTPLAIENYEWSADGKQLLIFTNSARVWRQNTRGDFWILDMSTWKLTQLGATFPASTLQFATFSPQPDRVAYVQKNDLYVEESASGKITRLTRDGSDTVINGTGDWVYEEELGLRHGFCWSPDGQFIAFWHLDSTGIKDYFLINNTDTLYPRIIPIKYPKVGEMNSACQVGVVPSAGGAVTWLKIAGDARDHYIAKLFWRENSREVVAERLNRRQNANQVMFGNALSGDVRVAFTDSDAAWVDAMADFHWLDKGAAFTWLSERDGWRRLYHVMAATGKARPITPGNADVIDVALADAKGGWLYYRASPENAGQRYLFRTRLDGTGKAVRITPRNQPGTHNYQIAPNAAWAIHTYSTLDTPLCTELVSLPAHRRIRTLAANQPLCDRVKALDRQPVEFFRVAITGGVELDGWCIKPPHFDPSRSYPVLFYIYGEPAGQTVLDNWRKNTYLWHLMLAQQGYVVMSVDPRGTPAPRGRDWRKCVYGKVGITASVDHAQAVQALLAARPYLDRNRVAIWGWSGGGSMTLNALFRYPDLYKTGMAVAAVSDQRLYDTIYQERYMGLLADNAEGYEMGSPIHFAKQLKGNLLLVHGTGDDNVHYQSFERLVNELVAHNLTFTMMAYPNRSHGIYEGEGTTLHLYRLLTDYLLQHVPPGAK